MQDRAEKKQVDTLFLLENGKPNKLKKKEEKKRKNNSTGTAMASEG